MKTYTRRDKQELTPEILGRYHALVMQGDVPGFEALLEKHAPHLAEEVKRELVEDFMRVSARAVRLRWLSSK